MKLYNRELKEIENAERRIRMQRLVKEVVEFLNAEYAIDMNFLQEKANKVAFVERESGESHNVEYNGKKEEILGGEGAASFVTHKSQNFDGKKWTFENAVYTGDTNSDHTIRHELFHYFSNILQMEFNKNGIGYDKSGVSITGYDSTDKIVDNSIHANGLNEGITELLAQKLDGNPTLSEPYTYQVLMVDLLVNSNDNTLIRAYFSKDEREFKEFLEEFEKRQSIVSSQDLVQLSEHTTFDNQSSNKLFAGCIEYSLSFCENEKDFNKEKGRLIKIIENISIADYKKGKETQEYLLSTINRAENKFEKNTKESKKDANQLSSNAEKRKQFAEGLINAYNATETDMQYKKRAEESMRDVVRLHNIIKLKGKDNCLIEFDGEKDFTEEQISSIVRLLKTAQTLTNSQKVNPSGRNYLEEFINIDAINEILRKMKEDFKNDKSYMYYLREEARRNKESRNLPKFPLTEFEKETQDQPTSTGKDARGEKLEQIIGKSQEQVEREKKDEDARGRIDEQNKKLRKETTEDVNREIEIKSAKKSILKSKIMESETEQEMITMSELIELKKLQFKTSRTADENARYEELRQKKLKSEVNNQQLTGQKRENGMNR